VLGLLFGNAFHSSHMLTLYSCAVTALLYSHCSYDLPSEFNTRYLQGRNFAPACTWRGFTDQNTSIFR
jgi:hypothetical protein